jgi:lysophospholipase L1-like esterase
MSDTAQIVRKYLVVSSILPLVLGCASMQQPNLHSNILQRNTETTPRIEFVGDDISIGLVAYANHELWKCTDCASGATSAQLLAALPLAIARRPDLVHILVGSYDMEYPTDLTACNENDPVPGTDPCTNIQAMIAQLNAAKIPFILGSIPEWQPGTLSDQLAVPVGGVDIVQANEDLFNRWIVDAFLPPSPPVYTVDYYLALNDPSDISSNGIDPSPAGYEIMLTLAQAAIDQMHTGELR